MLRMLAAGVALVAALAVVGCVPPEPTETTTPVATPSESSEPTPSATALSDTQVLEQSLRVATALNELVDQAFRDGVLPRAALADIASAELIDTLQSDLDGFVSRGLRLEGSSTLDTPTLVANQRASENSGSAVIATCMDTSETTTYDANGAVVSGGVERQPRLFEIDYSPEMTLVTGTGPAEDSFQLQGCG